MKKFKDADGTIMSIEKYPNGKYYNNYNIGNKSSTCSSVGPFNTQTEAKKWLKKHRPKAIEIVDEYMYEDIKVILDGQWVEISKNGTPIFDGNTSAKTAKEAYQMFMKEADNAEDNEGDTFTPYMRTRSGKTIYAADYGKKVFKF